MTTESSLAFCNLAMFFPTKLKAAAIRGSKNLVRYSWYVVVEWLPRSGPKGSHHVRKLDGVGPVDNRPSTDKLHHFVRRKKIMTCDM